MADPRTTRTAAATSRARRHRDGRGGRRDAVSTPSCTPDPEVLPTDRPSQPLVAGPGINSRPGIRSLGIAPQLPRSGACRVTRPCPGQCPPIPPRRDLRRPRRPHRGSHRLVARAAPCTVEPTWQPCEQSFESAPRQGPPLPTALSAGRTLWRWQPERPRAQWPRPRTRVRRRPLDRPPHRSLSPDPCPVPAIVILTPSPRQPTPPPPRAPV